MSLVQRFCVINIETNIYVTAKDEQRKAEKDFNSLSTHEIAELPDIQLFSMYEFANDVACRLTREWTDTWAILSVYV